MKIAEKSRILSIISAIVIVASVTLVLVFGLKLGIDFTGGSLVEVSFSEDRPEPQQVEDLILSQEIESVEVKNAGENELLIRLPDIENQKKDEILVSISENFSEATENRFEKIGPTLGKELREKSVYAIVGVLVAIVIFLAYAFRKVSGEVKSWKFGVAAIVALIHDIAIIIGVFVLLGQYLGVEVDSLFVTALLTVLGFSVHDTIVVFDRFRYNLLKKESSETIDNLANRSIKETIVRSINTSSTTLIVLLCLLLFGGEPIRWFVVALAIGVVAGTYSSIFVATPALMLLQKMKKK